MKKILLLCAALSLAACPVWAASGWGLYGAFWDTSDADSGSGLGLRVDVEMVPSVNLQLRTAYFDDLADDVGGIDVDLEVIPVEVGLALMVPVLPGGNFYVGAGLGYYQFDVDVDAPGPATADPDDEIGYYMVAGFEAAVTDTGADYGRVETSIFGEFKYTAVEVDELGLGGATRDVELNGPGFNLGLMIRW